MKRFYTCLVACMVAFLCVAQYNQLTNIPTVYIDTHNGVGVCLFKNVEQRNTNHIRPAKKHRDICVTLP